MLKINNSLIINIFKELLISERTETSVIQTYKHKLLEMLQIAFEINKL